MPDILFSEMEIVVNTLLQVGELVLDISKDHIICKIWDRDGHLKDGSVSYEGKKLSQIPPNDIIARCENDVRQAFATGNNVRTNYTVDSGNATITYSVRTVIEHPADHRLFVVIDRVSEKANIGDDVWGKVVSATSDGIFDIDFSKDTISFSGRWYEIFGYNVNEITKVADWTSQMHPDDLSVAQKIFADYAAGHSKMYSMELRYKCKDGSYKWILSRAVIVSRQPDGSPLRFIGTHTDINERKITEQKYAASSRLLSKLVDNLQSGILVTDEHLKVVFANRIFCDMYEIAEAPETLIGSDVSEGMEVRKHFFKNEEEFVRSTKEILQNNELVLNEELAYKDGRIFGRNYIPISIDKNKAGGIWTLTDITQQKTIEKRLEEQRYFYENILHHIPADIAVFDAQHTYLFVNKHAFKNEELRQFMIGKTDIDYAKRSNRPDSFVNDRWAFYDSAVAAKGEVKWIEHLTNKQGKKEHHLRLLHPVFHDDGSLELLLAYGLDVTELIESQEALKRVSETFSSAFEYSGLGMALLSPEGKWLDVNKVICDFTGYTKEELLSTGIDDITYPEDRDTNMDFVKKMLRKEISTYTMEKRYVSKEKKIILVLLTVSMVWNNDGTPGFFICQLLDITQRKALETEISKKNTELESTKVSLVNKVAQLEELSHIIAHNLRGPAGNIKALAGALVAKNKGGKYAEENPLSDAFTTEEAIEFIEESSVSLMSSLSTLMKISEIKLNKGIPYNVCDVAVIIKDITTQLHSVIFEKRAVINLDLTFKQVNYPKAYLENVLYNLISNALKYTREGIAPDILISTDMHDGRIRLIVRDNGLGIDMERHGEKLFKLNGIFHKGFDSKGVGLYITKTQIESIGGSIELISKPNEGCEFIVTF